MTDPWWRTPGVCHQSHLIDAAVGPATWSNHRSTALDRRDALVIPHAVWRKTPHQRLRTTQTLHSDPCFEGAVLGISA